MQILIFVCHFFNEFSEEEDVQSAPLSKKQKAKALAAANKKQLKVAKDEDEDDDDDDEGSLNRRLLVVQSIFDSFFYLNF